MDSARLQRLYTCLTSHVADGSVSPMRASDAIQKGNIVRGAAAMALAWLLGESFEGRGDRRARSCSLRR